LLALCFDTLRSWQESEIADVFPPDRLSNPQGANFNFNINKYEKKANRSFERKKLEHASVLVGGFVFLSPPAVQLYRTSPFHTLLAH
jgi:hypothetical protein